MFEKFLRANAGDFRQRYEGTYGFYRDEKGKRMLAQLTGIGESVCAFMDARGIEYKLNADVDQDIGFEFLPPKSGYFNTRTGAMLVKRVAARQFQRGVSSKNISIHLLNNGTLYQQRVDFPRLESIYEKSVPTEVAVKQFMARDVPSVALSASFGLDNEGQVWVLDEVIGTYRREKDTYKVKLNEKCLFKTEFTDACRALALPVEIS